MNVCSPLAPPEYLAGIRGVIFDCDGVLVDSHDSNTLYYNLIRQRLGMSPISPEEEIYVHMHAVAECLARIIPPERLEEAEAARASLDYREVLPSIVLEQGLVELLDVMETLGLRMAVHTNRTNTVERLLRHFAIDRYFSPVISAGSLKRPKPDPEGVFMILDAWELPKDAVAYIGDSSLDERSAGAAGIRFWAYKNPALSAAMHLTDFGSLRACLEGGRSGPAA